MTPYRFCPGFTEDDLWKATREYWNIDDYSFPVPKKVSCVCGEENPQLKSYALHRSDARTIPYRADVTFKCTNCARVWKHGVVIPEDMYWDLKENAIGLRWVHALALMLHRGELDEDEYPEHVLERAREVLKNRGKS